MRRVVVLKGAKRSLRVEAPKGVKRSLRVEVARPPLLPPVVKKAEVELVQAKVQKVVQRVDRSLGQKVDQSLGQKVNRALRVAVARPPLLPPVAKKAEVELVQAKAQKGEFLSVSGQNTISLLSHGSHCHSIVSGSEESGSDDDASESSS